jgi:hypothetical protein
MAGKSFYRGLRSGTFKEMDRFFHTPVGRAILETKFQDKPVFQVCLRDNYLNVYWRGCSVLRYEPDARENTFIIHRKYTEAKGTHIKTNEYIRLMPSEGDRDLVRDSNGWRFIENVIEPASRGGIPLIKEYAKGEKAGIHDYLLKKQPFLLDLELGFTRRRTDNEMKHGVREMVADRMDMARVVLNGGTPVLQLVEVKLDTNNCLRSNTEPRILDQMERYQDFITRQGRAIMASYRSVADIYLRLGFFKRMPPLAGLRAEVILKTFMEKGELDQKPYLLVLGKKDNLVGRMDHYKRLCEYFYKRGYPIPEFWSAGD